MEILRVVITGGVGAGKTSFIRTISETDAVDTDKRATDETAQFKPQTTVAMDFGTIAILNQSLHLYGTPGQARFDFMRDILIQKAQACMVLADATRPEHMNYAREIIDLINNELQIPYLVGLTHTDSPNALALSDAPLALGLSIQVAKLQLIAVNPTDQVSVKSAILKLLELR
jgi:uncharacterized protein